MIWNFKDGGMKITDQGHKCERFLGSVIGTESCREQYIIKDKVKDCVKNLQLLSKKYAQDQRWSSSTKQHTIQYSEFTKALSSQLDPFWYFQRTVPYMSDLFEPLENTIRDHLIPALVGWEVLVMQKDKY